MFRHSGTARTVNNNLWNKREKFKEWSYVLVRRIFWICGQQSRFFEVQRLKNYSIGWKVSYGKHSMNSSRPYFPPRAKLIWGFLFSRSFDFFCFFYWPYCISKASLDFGIPSNRLFASELLLCENVEE